MIKYAIKQKINYELGKLSVTSWTLTRVRVIVCAKEMKHNKKQLLRGFQWEKNMNESNTHRNKRDPANIRLYSLGWLKKLINIIYTANAQDLNLNKWQMKDTLIGKTLYASYNKNTKELHYTRLYDW